MNKQKTLKDMIIEKGIELASNTDYYNWLMVFCKKNGYVTTDAVLKHYGSKQFSNRDKVNIDLLPFFFAISKQVAKESGQGYYEKENKGNIDSYVVLFYNQHYSEVHQIRNNEGCKYFFTDSFKNRAYSGAADIFGSVEKAKIFEKK